VFDFFFQDGMEGGSADFWHGASFMARHTLGEKCAVAARVEYFSDKSGVLITTGTPENFQTVSGSVNFDYAPAAFLTWRVEGRLFASRDPIYASKVAMKKTDGASLSL
jgi:hypothetical protein